MTIFEELIEELKERDKKGFETYGKPMQAFDGRDTLRDALEEALDLVVYLYKAIKERDSK